MELVSAHVRRALAYLRLLNDNGVDPSSTQLDAIAREQDPQGAEYQSVLFKTNIAYLLSLTERKVRDADRVAEYLGKVDWVDLSNGRLRLRAVSRTHPARVRGRIAGCAQVSALPRCHFGCTKLSSASPAPNPRHYGVVAIMPVSDWAPLLTEHPTRRGTARHQRRQKMPPDLHRMALGDSIAPSEYSTDTDNGKVSSRRSQQRL
ncbi:hypothetical protein QRX50_20145 [Amycolatopsis carbonis]|uniref:Uncharacterized protein n=1 Tax=Amycolatopsis carbonis TaxID=715471 RepID=A0A9Y2IPR4_9PSEU|nr:hypothetical protein [Amycolatopsis sp. 2-15]WIX82911.1 hypothetical protein QRX50_20145 [Amycolatopsis sp. 2-15]